MCVCVKCVRVCVCMFVCDGRKFLTFNINSYNGVFKKLFQDILKIFAVMHRKPLNEGFCICKNISCKEVAWFQASPSQSKKDYSNAHGMQTLKRSDLDLIETSLM